MLKTSKDGLEFIARHEGLRLVAYKLKGEKYFTIGYGHYGPDVKEGMRITKDQALLYLQKDLDKFERYVNAWVPYGLSQAQFDALVSYTYNRGPKGLKQLVEASRGLQEYPDNMVKYWGSAERYKDALIRRRKEEAKLFQKDMPNKSSEVIALEVIGGKWGSGAKRRQKLEEAGYNYDEVQKAVNYILNQRK